MWEIKVEMCSDETHLFISATDNSLPVPAERQTYIFIPVLSQRPPTVWLVTAGSGPHISGTQLPCRHVLMHTHTHIRRHTHVRTLACFRQTGTGKQRIWTASEQKHTFLFADEKPCICKKDNSAKNKSVSHWAPCVLQKVLQHKRI